MSTTTTDPEVIEQIKILRADGKSLRAIGRELGIHQATVKKYVELYADQIKQLEEVATKVLLEKYRLHREGQIERLAALIDLVEDELTKGGGKKIKEMEGRDLLRGLMYLYRTLNTQTTEEETTVVDEQMIIDANERFESRIRTIRSTRKQVEE